MFLLDVISPITLIADAAVPFIAVASVIILLVLIFKKR